MKMKRNTNNWIIGILILIVVLFLVSSLTGSGMVGMMGTGFWFFGWIFMVLIIIALVLLIAWLIKQLQK